MFTDLKPIPITISDSNGVGVDITGATVYFTVRDNNGLDATDDNDVILKVAITSHTTPASGITKMLLTATNTDIVPGDYYWELQVVFTDGAVQTTTASILTILPDLTKGT